MKFKATDTRNKCLATITMFASLTGGMSIAHADYYGNYLNIFSGKPGATKKIYAPDNNKLAYITSNINPLNGRMPTTLPPQKSEKYFFDAIKNGTPLFWDRFRNEDVNKTGFKNSQAYTNAVHLGWQTANFGHVSGTLEFTNTVILGHQKYNSGGGTSPFMTNYATINDPKGTRVDQVFLEYDNFFKTDVKVGRQRIQLDNQRFIGNSGWRQMEQTYDAASFYNAYIPNLNLFYAYVAQVNRVWGPNGTGVFSNNTNHTHIINGRYDVANIGSLTGYGYLINDPDNFVFSTKTGGVRFNGGTPFGCKAKFLYTLEFANQGQAAHNPVHYSANYTHYAAGVGFDTILGDAELDLAQENLRGSKSKTGAYFRTPYASLHAFQGWAEMFNTTPNRGVVDSYAAGSITLKKLYDIKLLAFYHHFDQSASSGSFGNEIDFEISKDFNKYINATIDYANFMSNNKSYPDTKRIWFIVKTPFA